MIRPPEFCPWCRSSLVPRPTDGLERLSCSAPDCEFVHWDNPTPVVAAVVEHEGRIVLAQNRAWPVKFFGLITGFWNAMKTRPKPCCAKWKKSCRCRAAIRSSSAITRSSA